MCGERLRCVLNRNSMFSNISFLVLPGAPNSVANQNIYASPEHESRSLPQRIQNAAAILIADAVVLEQSSALWPRTWNSYWSNLATAGTRC